MRSIVPSSVMMSPETIMLPARTSIRISPTVPTFKSAELVRSPVNTVTDTSPDSTATPVSIKPSTSVITTSPEVALLKEALVTSVLMSATPTPPMPVSAFKLRAPEVEMFAVSKFELSMIAPLTEAPDPAVTVISPDVLRRLLSFTSVTAVKVIAPDPV